jgi:capsular polysaccharide biosynthesis protein
MEEINIKDLLDYFVSKIYVMLGILLVVLFIGAGYLMFIQKPAYRAYTTLVLTRIIEANEDSTSITQNDLLLNQKLVSTYREIIKSRPILKGVIEDLSLSYSVTELSEMIEVSSVKDTELIKISVSSGSALDSSEIANSIASNFSTRIAEIYNIKNLSIIEKAEVPSEAYNIDVIKQMLIFTFLGIALSLGFVFVIYYFDTTIKDEEDIDKVVGLPILGVVPYIMEGGRFNE